MEKYFDAVVIGAGHAGVEAGLALARRGHTVLVSSLSLNAVAFMACNPNIGGTAKGHLVREIDALGGEMGVAADVATIQTRMLNLGNGPAVHSLRAQVDKDKYHRVMKRTLEEEKNLTLLESEITDIVVENGKVLGARSSLGDVFSCRAVVVCTGVYLKAKIIIGQHFEQTGPSGYKRAEHLTESLLSLGLPIRRFKTGTPARVLASTVDFSKMEPQCGDTGIPKFSTLTKFEVENSFKCYLTYTNEKTHKIILDNLDKAPLYNGSISGVGPRYCPSIETKVVRFSDKERHQIFIEPEGADTHEVYVQGLSTSMPFDVQEQMVHSIAGLENAKIMRYGYAIEYDCIDPQILLPSLAVKGIEGLYCAGQINGSSGYEEAAAQGLMAGINAGLFIEGKEPFILSRAEAYIGVLIDDLVTKGTNEPYRMMTSRAEHRLHLRQDNADLRLTEKGYEIGLVTGERYELLLAKRARMSECENLLKRHYSPARVEAVFSERGESLPKSGISGREILRRNNIHFTDMVKIDSELVPDEALWQMEIEIKYEGYLEKQAQEIKLARKMEEYGLSPDTDYFAIKGLRTEAQQKLDKVRPLTLAQAARISGVNPADITVLMLHLHTKKA